MAGQKIDIVTGNFGKTVKTSTRVAKTIADATKKVANKFKYTVYTPNGTKVAQKLLDEGVYAYPEGTTIVNGYTGAKFKLGTSTSEDISTLPSEFRNLMGVEDVLKRYGLVGTSAKTVAKTASKSAAKVTGFSVYDPYGNKIPTDELNTYSWPNKTIIKNHENGTEIILGTSTNIDPSQIHYKLLEIPNAQSALVKHKVIKRPLWSMLYTPVRKTYKFTKEHPWWSTAIGTALYFTGSGIYNAFQDKPDMEVTDTGYVWGPYRLNEREDRDIDTIRTTLPNGTTVDEAYRVGWDQQ